MTEHLTPDELESLARGTFPGEQARSVFDHLLRGCGECFTALASAVPFLWREPQVPAPAPASGRAPPASDGDGQPRVGLAGVPPAGPAPPVLELARAADALTLLRQGGLPVLAAAPGLGPLAVCLALLRHARTLRHGEPAPLVAVASWAALAAKALDPCRYGVQFVADLLARAWGELGNAYRVADDLVAAEQTLAEASLLAGQGTGAPLLRALLLEFMGSLCGAQRRFSEAFATFDAARALYAESGERQQIGRVLISKGLYTCYANDLDRAIHLLRNGLALVDEEREPQLALAAVHNIVYSLAELGRFLDARALLRQNRERYERHAGAMDLIKRTWLEGAIAAGLGELEMAESCLLEASAGFKAAGARYDHALVSLDLAAIWLRRGETLPARQLVEESALVFRQLGIAREALAALLMLERAFELEVASLALVEPVTSYLRRLARDPGARFEPGET